MTPAQLADVEVAVIAAFDAGLFVGILSGVVAFWLLRDLLEFLVLRWRRFRRAVRPA